MLTITMAAGDRLTELLADLPHRVAARMVRTGRRMRLRRGEQRPGDQTIEHNGRIVLLLATPVVKRLRNRVLDVNQTADGPRLRFNRPAAQEI